MSTKGNPAGVPVAPGLELTRVLDAPRAAVFAAWTDPERVAQWWGPEGFANPVCKLDVRRGGAIRIDMRGPDGTVYPMTGTYREVVEPARLVFTGTALDERGRPIFAVLNTVSFEGQGDQTTLTLRTNVLKTTTAAAEYLKGMEAGWTQSLERLARHLASGSTRAADRELVMTRTFDAPRELVWKAWTDDEQLRQWWGPAGFTTTTHKMDLRPGGVWRFTMHGPDGRDYENLITYGELVEPERLTYKHGGDKDCEPVNFEVAVAFEKAGNTGEGTKLTMRMLFLSRDALEFVVREYGALEGGKQTLSRLAEHLERVRTAGLQPETTAERPFVITRVFQAPIERVFEVWTQREHLMRWFGPKGCTIPSCMLDFHVGGVFRYCMQMADGNAHWGKWVFREIVRPERLVFVVSFADEAGNAIRAPFDANWPLETLSTVTFAPHAGKGGGTVASVQWVPINASEIERKAFAVGHESMRRGWNGTCDQLSAYVATL